MAFRGDGAADRSAPAPGGLAGASDGSKLGRTTRQRGARCLRSRLRKTVFSAFEALVGGKIDPCRQCGSPGGAESRPAGLMRVGMECMFDMSGSPKWKSWLNNPMLRVQITELRKLHKAYPQSSSITELLVGVEQMQSAFGGETQAASRKETPSERKLQHEDLRLICFDVPSG